MSVQIYSRKIHRGLLNPDIEVPEPQMTESWVCNQRSTTIYLPYSYIHPQLLSEAQHWIT